MDFPLPNTISRSTEEMIVIVAIVGGILARRVMGDRNAVVGTLAILGGLAAYKTYLTFMTLPGWLVKLVVGVGVAVILILGVFVLLCIADDRGLFQPRRQDQANNSQPSHPHQQQNCQQVKQPSQAQIRQFNLQSSQPHNFSRSTTKFYHGTPKRAWGFDIYLNNRWKLGPSMGVYFTTNFGFAAGYALKGETGVVVELFIPPNVEIESTGGEIFFVQVPNPSMGGYYSFGDQIQPVRILHLTGHQIAP